MTTGEMNWLKQKRTPGLALWITREDENLFVYEMETRHLSNCLNLLTKNGHSTHWWKDLACEEILYRQHYPEYEALCEAVARNRLSTVERNALADWLDEHDQGAYADEVQWRIRVIEDDEEEALKRIYNEYYE